MLLPRWFHPNILTLQMTTQFYVRSHDGRKLKARALLDSGASISLVSQRLAQQLHLRKHRQYVTISGVQDISTGVSTHATSFYIDSTDSSESNLLVSAAIDPKVTTDLPLQVVIEADSWDFLKGLNLADPSFSTPRRIDLILGANVLHQILTSGGTLEQPIASLAGPSQVTLQQTTGPGHLPNNHSRRLRCLAQILLRIKGNGISLTPEEISVNKHFDNHHHHTPEG